MSRVKLIQRFFIYSGIFIPGPIRLKNLPTKAWGQIPQKILPKVERVIKVKNGQKKPQMKPFVILFWLLFSKNPYITDKVKITKTIHRIVSKKALFLKRKVRTEYEKISDFNRFTRSFNCKKKWWVSNNRSVKNGQLSNSCAYIKILQACYS